MRSSECLRERQFGWSLAFFKAQTSPSVEAAFFGAEIKFWPSLHSKDDIGSHQSISLKVKVKPESDIFVRLNGKLRPPKYFGFKFEALMFESSEGYIRWQFANYVTIILHWQ